LAFRLRWRSLRPLLLRRRRTNLRGRACLPPRLEQVVQRVHRFTEDQARARLEGARLTNVTELKKDDDGIWRGKATRDGKSVTVAFDYKGNIAIQ